MVTPAKILKFTQGASARATQWPAIRKVIFCKSMLRARGDHFDFEFGQHSIQPIRIIDSVRDTTLGLRLVCKPTGCINAGWCNFRGQTEGRVYRKELPEN
jgi:hypothetical protein